MSAGGCWHLLSYAGEAPASEAHRKTLCGKARKGLRITVSPDRATCTPCERRHLREGDPGLPVRAAPDTGGEAMTPLRLLWLAIRYPELNKIRKRR